MKNPIFLILFIAATLLGCSKTNNSMPEPIVVSPGLTNNSTDFKIVLNNVEGSGSNVKLTWSKLDVERFNFYVVERNEEGTTNFVKIAEINDKNQVSYVDNDAPFTEKVQYRVYSSNGSVPRVISNTVTYSRSNLKIFNITPYDVIYNKDDQLLYVIERGPISGGVISLYDIAQDKVVKTATADVSFGFADLGHYNNEKALYVPTGDGFVYVYSALTLNKLKQINVGAKSYSVVYNGNNLYVSTALFNNNPIKIINPVTGTINAGAGFWGTTRLKAVPNTDFDIMEITSIDVSPVDQAYYKFTSNGQPISRTEDKYHGDYKLDDRIFEFFPDGSRYITSSAGNIFNKQMAFVASLPKGNKLFTSFATDIAQSKIYASTSSKTIEVYSATNYGLIKSIYTSAYPFKIIDIGDQILCVSLVAKIIPCCNDMPQSINGITIERINK